MSQIDYQRFNPAFPDETELALTIIDEYMKYPGPDVPTTGA